MVMAIPVYLIAALLDKGLFRRLLRSRKSAMALAVVFAVAVVIALDGALVTALGWRWVPWPGSLLYVASGAFVLIIMRRRLRRSAGTSPAALQKTFE